MRCKRCGSNISFDNEICPGCGKSLVLLKGDNEIEFDDKVEIKVENIKDATPKNASVNEIVEEKVVEDVFGEALKESSGEVTPIPKLEGLKQVFDKKEDIAEEKKSKNWLVLVLIIVVIAIGAIVFIKYGQTILDKI